MEVSKWILQKNMDRGIKMKLVIGGYAQGKLHYVINNYFIETEMIWDGELPKLQEDMTQKGSIIFNHFHQWVRSCLVEGTAPEEKIWQFLEQYPDCIIISDEIGNGIVPVDSFEREYRERTGRLLVELAGKAEEVVRVLCGIGQKIK